MCGIAGIATWRSNDIDIKHLESMTKQLIHRGPDGAGIWLDEEQGVALGHRRLAIIDLSPQGHQPMVSVSGRFILTYNGEIYNFSELRQQLEQTDFAPTWRGHSDTEVLLAAFEVWGVEKTLQKAVGMFAIALWDKTSKTLILARDRIGEKPLYYGNVDGKFVFASELKALRAGVENKLNIDRDALAEYMRFGYVPAPQSIYSGVYKLLPGHYIVLNDCIELPLSRPYWQLDTSIDHELSHHLNNCPDEELVALVHDRLSDAVKLQMVSDVPLGAFLSGGVDSSTVVALMQSHSTQQIRTYTIGFNDHAFNEAPHARAVAKHLNTDHTEIIVTAQDAIDLIPSLPLIYDEPFADSSQIPTTLVSRLTRKHVTVALSGDGGDELFMGYPRYQITASLWQRISSQPLLFRKTIARLLAAMSAQGWDRLLTIVPISMRTDINGRRIHRLAESLACTSLGEIYIRLMSRWQPETAVVIGATSSNFSTLTWFGGKSHLDAMRAWDIRHYLSDDLLVKVDRSAMSTSLETRAPLLDHRVVELALALPERVLIRDGVGKWVLRKVLDRYVPQTLIDRPKAGFEVPLADWLRGPLLSWAHTLLDPIKLKNEGYLDEDKVSEMWAQHLSCKADRSHYIWSVLMFEAWLDARNSTL